MLTCAFTGHRPDKLSCGYDENHAICVSIKAALARQIERLFVQRGIKHFISGGAPGVDIWAAEAVLSFRKEHADVTLTIAVPFQSQSDKFPADQQLRYMQMLKNADEVIVLQEAFTKDCFFKRNDYMIGSSDVLIAVCDRHSNMRSGTRYTVNEAVRQGRNIIFIDPNTQAISYHIGK